MEGLADEIPTKFLEKPMIPTHSDARSRRKALEIAHKFANCEMCIKRGIN